MTIQQDNSKELADLKKELGLAASASAMDVVSAAMRQLDVQNRRAENALKNFPRIPKPQ